MAYAIKIFHALPWVPETFLARFPVFVVASAYRPFLAPTFSNSVWSPMGAIPKRTSEPPKWRIINDLSWPAGQSVNDAFSKELYTCSYDSIDQAISYLKSFAPNALISKLDHAFHLILVDPRDWEILESI